MPDTRLPTARKRRMALNADHVARVFRAVPETDLQREGMTLLTDEDKRAVARDLLREMGDAPFWIFAYGSLIWNPAFEFAEARRATAHGWKRDFCIHLDGWRGTPEQPGLMLALSPGGSCVGMAYRMPDDDREERMVRLVEREMGYHEHRLWLRFLTLRAGGETIRALTFYCTPPEAPQRLHLPLAEQARRIALACGPKGANVEYLYNTVSHLEESGIHDSYLWRMQKLVAAEIDALDA